jgi:hypothetical protein
MEQGAGRDAGLVGGCACGAVRYEVHGEPFHRTLCHCNDCRRAAGAPAVAWFSVRPQALRWVCGRPRWRRSSLPVERAFCPDCGTQLAYRHAGFPDAIDVTTCSLDDPDRAAPLDHTRAAHRMRWLHLADDWPVYQGARVD